MSEPDILYPAIFVFTMLLIGLLLTMWEFSRLQKSALKQTQERKATTGEQSRVGDTRVTKVSGF
jgi:hypothetical protein